MAPKRNTLLCTVGTSLFANLRRLTETPQSDPDREALATAYSPQRLADGIIAAEQAGAHRTGLWRGD